MDLRRLTSKAKDMFAKRGGSEAAKKDAQELKDIARGDASLGDKAKQGFDALKEPGGPGPEPRPERAEPRPGAEERRPGAEERRPGAEERRPPAERQRPRP
jgi:hypothetical protein